MAAETLVQALANPGVHFALVDYNVNAPNVKPVEFDTAQAAFLAGYFAAYMSKTKIVATFGDVNEPGVTSTMDGFVNGVVKYNEIHHGIAVVHGWNTVSRTGLFVGINEDFAVAKSTSKAMAKNLLDAGADIIMPITGQAGVGAAEAALEKRNSLLVWVGSDGYETLPAEFRPIILTSVVKKADDAIANIVTDDAAGVFSSSPYRGTLANLGVNIAPPHSLEPDVPSALSAEIDLLRAQLVAGQIVAGLPGAAR